MNQRAGQMWTSFKREKMQCQEEKSGGANGIDGLVNKNFGIPKEEEEATMDSKDFGFGFLLKPREITTMKEVPVAQPNKVEVLDNKAAILHARRFWTKEEHRQFLCGLNEYGRGSWKIISKKFIPTRTPVQVSSHAQKYYKRLESKRAGKQLRYSINDVKIDEIDPLAPENSPDMLQPLAFIGGACGCYTSLGMQTPALTIPFSNMNVNNFVRFRSSFSMQRSHQQPAQTGVQMSANSITSPMSGARRFVPAHEEVSSNMNNIY